MAENENRDAPELMHLRAFVAIVETGSHLGAAQHLGIHVKSVGRYIRSVQEYFGEGLFEAGKDHGKLTERGRVVEALAREILALLDAGRDRVAVECPVLRVGFVRMMRPLVERALRRRVTTQPADRKVELRLFELTSEQQARALMARELDIAICFKLHQLSDCKDFYELEVSEHPYALAVPAHVVQNGDVSRTALSALHYTRPPFRLSPDVIEAGARWLADKGVAPKLTIECELATQIIAYAGAGIGFGPVPALWSAASREGVVFLPLPSFGTSAKISVYALNHASDHTRILRAELRDAARAALGEH